MSPASLAELVEAGVRVSAKGDRLLVEGPPEVLTDALLEQLREAKPAILRLLRARATGAPCNYLEHRRSDWVTADGRLLCGICHPDPRQPSTARNFMGNTRRTPEYTGTD